MSEEKRDEDLSATKSAFKSKKLKAKWPSAPLQVPENWISPGTEDMPEIDIFGEKMNLSNDPELVFLVVMESTDGTNSWFESKQARDLEEVRKIVRDFFQSTYTQMRKIANIQLFDCKFHGFIDMGISILNK